VEADVTKPPLLAWAAWKLGITYTELRASIAGEDFSRQRSR
jgi:hypothetical protein